VLSGKKHICQHFYVETICVFPDLVCLILPSAVVWVVQFGSYQVEDDVVILRPLQGTAIIFNGRLDLHAMFVMFSVCCGMFGRRKGLA